MNERNVIYTTSHPAPYMDVIYEKLQNKYDLITYYNREKDTDKSWKKQNNMIGKLVNDTSFVEKLKDSKASSFAVLGGWGQKSNILFMIFFIIFRKPFAVFSDVPDAKNITNIKIFIKKIMLGFIPFLFVTGESCKQHYKKYYNVPENKIKIFPYGIKIPDRKRINETNQKRKELIEGGARINILVANRFIKRKGYKTLFESFKLLNKVGLLDRFNFTIVGDGILFDEYKKIFNKLSINIKLLGWIEMEEYEQLIQDTDILIHASYFEPYGIPVVDAMVHGKLVVASDGVMSAQDFILNRKNGFIYKSMDYDQLYHILKEVCESTVKIYEIGDEALKVASIYSSFDHVKTINSCCTEGRI